MTSRMSIIKIFCLFFYLLEPPGGQSWDFLCKIDFRFSIANFFIKVFSVGSVNSSSRKIHALRQLFAFHGITFHFSGRLKFSSVSREITKSHGNCQSRKSHFTQLTQREITPTLAGFT